MPTRRIITSHDGDARSIVRADGTADDITIALAPGMVFTPLWGSDEAAVLSAAGKLPTTARYFPAPGGATATLVTVPPDSQMAGPPPDMSPEALEAMMAEGFADAEQKVPGLAGVMEPDAPGFHTTPTVDLVYVVSGTLVLEMTASDPVTLEPGDVVVQNGTRHAWRNPGDQPATMLAFSLGIEP